MEKLSEKNFIKNQFSGKRRLTVDEIDVTIKFVNGQKPQQGKRKSLCARNNFVGGASDTKNTFKEIFHRIQHQQKSTR